MLSPGIIQKLNVFIFVHCFTPELYLPKISKVRLLTHFLGFMLTL